MRNKGTNTTRGRARAALVWAALAAMSVVWVAPPEQAFAQDNGNSDQAEAAAAMYKLAVAAFQAGKYREALDKLQEVYELDPDPVILYNMGRAHEELGQLATAADFFQRAVADPGLPGTLQAEIGRRLPKVLPALKLREARQLSTRAVGISVRRGEDRALEAYVASQQNTEEPVEKPPFWKTPLFWTGAGMGLVGTGLLAGAVAIDTGLEDPINELQQTETRQDRARTLTLQDDIESDQTLATIFYVGGGLLLAGGATLAVLAVDPFSGEQGGEAAPGEGEEPAPLPAPGEAPETPPEEAPAAPEPEVRVAPAVGPSWWGVTIGGSFD